MTMDHTMITAEQAESRLTVVMAAQKNLQECIQAGISAVSIADQQKLIALYEQEWMGEIRTLIPDADEQIEKYLSRPWGNRSNRGNRQKSHLLRRCGIWLDNIFSRGICEPRIKVKKWKRERRIGR